MRSKNWIHCVRTTTARLFSHSSENSFQKLHTGKNGSEYIAYRKFVPSRPSKNVGVMFCQGFMSNMNGTKSLFLETYCKEKHINYVTYDYLGHGSSTGKIEDFTVGLWKRNTLEILNRVAEGPQIIVGSSMGGWIMLLTAIENPSKVHGLVGMAAAPDLMYHRYESISDQEKNELNRSGYFLFPSAFADQPLKLPFRIITDAKEQQVLNKKEICYDGPVHLIHGVDDSTVPYSYAMTISEKLRSTNVSVHLIKDGDHQLSRDSDLKFLSNVLDQLIFS